MCRTVALSGQARARITAGCRVTGTRWLPGHGQNWRGLCTQNKSNENEKLKKSLFDGIELKTHEFGLKEELVTNVGSNERGRESTEEEEGESRYPWSVIEKQDRSQR
jgi:hypothetical protein